MVTARQNRKKQTIKQTLSSWGDARPRTGTSWGDPTTKFNWTNNRIERL